MISGKRILAVVPARGGSKGVPLKNLHPVNGVPLVALTGKIVKEVKSIDRAVVSTDHVKIAEAAKSSGIDAPFTRPESLSGDRIGDWDVLTHALTEMERIDGTRYDIVVMLQPTCPMRKPKHVEDTIRKLVDDQLDSVWTVSESDLKLHPLKQLKLSSSGEMTYYDPQGKTIIARQQLTPLYHRNGAAYAITRECLLDQKTILGKKAGAVVVHDKLVNIDTLEDFELLDFYLAKEKRR